MTSTRSEPDKSWILKRLEYLSSKTGEIRAAGGVTQEFDDWAVLKHAILTASVEVYSNVAGARFDDIYYIDALAGSGVFEFTDSNDVMVGSPLIAATVPNDRKWTKMYLIEKDAARAEALRNRMKFICDNIENTAVAWDDVVVIEDDATDVLPRIPDRIKNERGKYKGAHHLSFVDNEGLTIPFESIRAMGDLWGDFLITYLSRGVDRLRGKNSYTKLSEFIGQPEWRIRQAESEDDLLGLYLKSLSNIDRPMNRAIRIDSRDNHPYHYHMIYAARRTGGDNPWFQFLDSLQSRVSGLSGSDVGKVRKIMRGEYSSLDIFSPTIDDSSSKLTDFGD